MTAVSDETGRGREYGTDCIDKLSERKLTCRELARYIWDRATRVPMCFEQDIARLIENERREAVRRSAPVAQEPVAFAWVYELAICKTDDGEYVGWHTCLSLTKPCVPDGSIRNIRPLYTSPPATAAGVGVDEIARLRDEMVAEFRNASSDPMGDLDARDEAHLRGIKKAFTAILALLSRGSGSDQANPQKDGSR